MLPLFSSLSCDIWCNVEHSGINVVMSAIPQQQHQQSSVGRERFSVSIRRRPINPTSTTIKLATPPSSSSPSLSTTSGAPPKPTKKRHYTNSDNDNDDDDDNNDENDDPNQHRLSFPSQSQPLVIPAIRQPKRARSLPTCIRQRESLSLQSSARCARQIRLAYSTVPEHLQYPLHSLVPIQWLYTSVFMCWSRCGSALLSYYRHQNGHYMLQFWRCSPPSPMTLIAQVPLFQVADGQPVVDSQLTFIHCGLAETFGFWVTHSWVIVWIPWMQNGDD
jgi:hypothetical protein